MSQLPSHRIEMVACIMLGISLHHSAFGQEFTNVAIDAGLGAVTTTNGVAVADYDGDGDLDVYFVAKDSYSVTNFASWNKLFRNDGHGRFEAVATSEALRGQNDANLENGMGNKMGAAWGDYDNDGLPDLYLTNLGPNVLLHNDGGGLFTDVTGPAGVAGGDKQLSTSSVWFDFDLDGDLDLYVSNWEDLSVERDRSNHLYENLGDGIFRDIAGPTGTDDVGSTWTTAALDVNSDGLPDLYLANDFGRNKLYIGRSDKTFVESTSEFGVEDIYHGMGIAIGDCDANGFLDIYVTNITEHNSPQETNPLFLNAEGTGFVNTASSAMVHLAGWGWGTDFFDMESDGDEDLFAATGYFLPEFKNVLFENHSEQSTFAFSNIADAAGVADLTAARGLAIADFDDDGDLDVLVSNVMDTPALYQNRTPQGSWLKLDLEGTTSNRNGVGAVVSFAIGIDAVLRLQHGAQYLGQNIVPIHVGLGTASSVDRVTVMWPGGGADTVLNLDVNQTVHIKEGVGLVAGTQSTDSDPGHRQTENTSSPTNFPNPFETSTQIAFRLSNPAGVVLRVFNVMGLQVHSEAYPMLSAGPNALRWTPAGRSGGGPASGIYVYQIEAIMDGSFVGSGTAIYLSRESAGNHNN